MDEEKQRTIYKVMSTNQLKDLARDFRSLKKEAIPILLDELVERGESDFVQQINDRIEKTKTRSNQEDTKKKGDFEDSFLGSLIQIEHPEQKKKQERNDELLDDDLITEDKVEDTSDLSDFDIVANAVKIIMKGRSKLHSREEATTLVKSKMKIPEYLIEDVYVKLTKKKNNSLIFGSIIAGLFTIGLMLLVTSNGENGFVPGIILLILGGSSLMTANHLNRILKN